MSAVTITKIDLTEVDTLLTFSRDCFVNAFAHLNNPADMEMYMASNFTTNRLSAELNNPYSEFYFAYTGYQLAGYIKLNYNDAQNEFKESDALEVERIYVAANMQNKQIGKQLLQFAEDKAIKKQFTYLWLGVWEHNNKAIRFYQRHGFSIIGSHDFMLGNDKQTDLLMRKDL